MTSSWTDCNEVLSVTFDLIKDGKNIATLGMIFRKWGSSMQYSTFDGSMQLASSPAPILHTHHCYCTTAYIPSRLHNTSDVCGG